jgi:NAD(P)-dependent dehydrogenase (short-subunit alcohol dehydrogenase family)
MAKVTTGSGNGLGRDIAEAVLAGDSVVAGARRTEELAPLVAQSGERVKPLTLEVYPAAGRYSLPTGPLLLPQPPRAAQSGAIGPLCVCLRRLL